MPDPLPSDIVARLRSDSTAALAASLVLAGSFPDIVSWALRAFSSKTNEPKASVPAEADGKSRHALRPQPAVKSDEALLALMRANPGASLADLIRLGRRPRSPPPVANRHAFSSFEPPAISPGSGPIGASGERLTTCWRRSTAGSPKASTPPTSKMRRGSWGSLPEEGGAPPKPYEGKS
jgi:hypothetical protein